MRRSSTAVLQQGWERRTITDPLHQCYTLFCIALYPPQSCHVVVCLLFPNCIFKMLTGNNLIIECRNVFMCSCHRILYNIRDLIWYDQVLQSPKKSKEGPKKIPQKMVFKSWYWKVWKMVSIIIVTVVQWECFTATSSHIQMVYCTVYSHCTHSATYKI